MKYFKLDKEIKEMVEIDEGYETHLKLFIENQEEKFNYNYV